MNEGYTQKQWDYVVGYGKVPPEYQRYDINVTANKTTEGPFKSAFESDTEGVIMREIITYRMRNGMMIKEEASRDYYKDGDYHDTQNTKPLPAP